MAIIPTEEETKKLLEPESNRILFKQALTRNPDWQPEDNGAGLVPEAIWLEKNPNSDPDTALSNEVEGRLGERNPNG